MYVNAIVLIYPSCHLSFWLTISLFHKSVSVFFCGNMFIGSNLRITSINDIRGYLSYPFFLINSYFIYLFIYLFSCVGSSFRARAFSSCGKREPLFIAVRGPFTIVAPPVAGHRLQMRRLSSCGSRSQLLRGTWEPPRPGLEPASPALAGRFSTTAPPGKPLSYPFDLFNLI